MPITGELLNGFFMWEQKLSTTKDLLRDDSTYSELYVRGVVRLENFPR